MSKQNRREFLQTSTCALAAGLSPMRSTLSRGAASGAAAPALGPAPVAQAVGAVDHRPGAARDAGRARRAHKEGVGLRQAVWNPRRADALRIHPRESERPGI